VIVEGIEEVYRTAIMPELGSGEFGIAVVIAVIGFLVVSFIDHMESRENPVLRLFWRKAPAPAGD